MGKEKKPTIIHSAAITSQSTVLNALLRNGMMESKTRSATLDDVEKKDFIRFCQFVYTGDYSTPPFTIEGVSKSKDTDGKRKKDKSKGGTTKPSFGFNSMAFKDSFPEAEDAPVGESDPEFAEEVTMETAFEPDEETLNEITQGSNANKKHKKKQKESARSKQISKATLPSVWASWGLDEHSLRDFRCHTTIREKFEKRKFFKEVPRQALLDSCEPISNTNPTQNFTPVFLAHARLYLFADKYLIRLLKQLALQKLQQTLVRFELYPERINDIIELIRYSYSDDNTLDNGSDELRALVILYVASRRKEEHLYEIFGCLYGILYIDRLQIVIL